jgi:hypothetical protein
MMGYRADFQALEIAFPDQYPERYPARTHSLPHLWPTDRYPGGATFVGVGFRPSSVRVAGAFFLQGNPMAHARRAVFESLS